MVASRFRCMYGATPRCDRGDGLPRRKTCRACGAALVVQRGVYGVVEHRGDGRYREADAVEFHRTDDKAFARACELGEQYVSRWFLHEIA